MTDTTYNAFQGPEREREPMGFAPELTMGDTLARQLFAFANSELEFAALCRLNDFRATQRDVLLAVAVCERQGQRTVADQLLALLTGEVVQS